MEIFAIPTKYRESHTNGLSGSLFNPLPPEFFFS